MSMKERPILFSAPMVRALLACTKTQTRRIMKNQPSEPPTVYQPSLTKSGSRPVTAAIWQDQLCICPYGVPGDRLWVRETHYRWGGSGTNKSVIYLADGAWIDWGKEPVWHGTCDLDNFFGRKLPGMLMPRFAARIALDLGAVRVERLQEISRGDAMDEGCPFPNMARGDDPRQWYAGLWESINGAGSWDANPWVWALTFNIARA